VRLPALLVAVATASAAVANPPPVPPAVRRALAGATVEVLPAGCAGVVVESASLVATAGHCVRPGAAPLRVVLADGGERSAAVAAKDDVADQVVLRLDRPAPVAVLAVLGRTPIVGTVLYFHGNPRRPRWQAARLDRVAPCPSLPGLPNALHTSIDGTPGDSGAPLVDLLARVVGLVHGGARCRIATPGARLVRLIDAALEREHA
jgi:trypsin-like peptidase